MLHNEIAKKNIRKLYKIQRKRQWTFKSPICKCDGSGQDRTLGCNDWPQKYPWSESLRACKQHQVQITFSFFKWDPLHSFSHSFHKYLMPGAFHVPGSTGIQSISASQCSDDIISRNFKIFSLSMKRTFSNPHSTLDPLPVKADLMIFIVQCSCCCVAPFNLGRLFSAYLPIDLWEP